LRRKAFKESFEIVRFPASAQRLALRRVTGRGIATAGAPGGAILSTEITRQKIEELNALRRQARAWRVGAAVASVAVSVMFLLILRSAANRLLEPGPTREVFLSELKTGLQTEVVPQVKTLAVQTVHDLTPRVKAELERLQQRSPELAEALTAELELFQKNLPARAEAVLRRTAGEAIRQREAQVRAMYPDLTEEKVGTIVGLLIAEAEHRLERVAAHVVTPFEEVIQRIVTDLQHIRDTEPVQVAGTEPAWELARFCASLLQEELSRQSPSAYQQFFATALAEERQ
jgi:hypothetical protein